MLYATPCPSASVENFSIRGLLRKSKEERAAMAATVLDQHLALPDGTVAQIAVLFGTTPSAIRRHRIRRGDGRRRKPSFAAILSDLCDADIAQIVAKHTERVWAAFDQLTTPSVAADE